MKWKKIIVAILIAIIAVTGTVGCSMLTKEEAKGRYVEEAITMPEAVVSGKEFVQIFTKNPKHQYEIYCCTESCTGEIKYTLQPDNTWKRDVPEWLQFKDMDFLGVTYAADGTMYVATRDFKIGAHKFKVHIYKSSDQKTFEEITPTDYKDAVESSKIPSNIAVLPDGRMILFFIKQVAIYKDGKLDISMPSGDYRYALSPDGKQLMFTNENMEGVVIVDTETGKTLSEIPCQGGFIDGAVTSDSNGNWYVLNQKGISRLIKNGSVLETIVDGSPYSMHMLNGGLPELRMGEKDDFYAMYATNGDTGMREIYHYSYKEDIPSSPQETLTIISLYEYPAVRQAMMEFQNKNNNVKVEYRSLSSESSGATIEDQVKMINTELFAGKGADIYILDGLPIDSYIEKGVLADISDLIKPMTENGQLLSNIMDCYQKQGAIYMAPFNFVAPIAFGDKNVLNSTSSIQALAEYQAKHTEKALFGENVKSNEQIVSTLYYLYSSSFIGADRKVNKEGLLQFLEALNTICTRSKVIDDKDATKDDKELYAPVDVSHYYDEISELGYVYVSSDKSFYAPSYAINKRKGDYASVNSSFMSVGLVGVNNASSKKELAYDFLREVFSDKVQQASSGNGGNGLPVNAKVLEKYIMDPNNNYISGPNGFKAFQPEEKERKKLVEIAKSLNNPINMDRVLQNMITEDIMNYLEGKADVTSTVEKIMSKATTYLAE